MAQKRKKKKATKSKRAPKKKAARSKKKAKKATRKKAKKGTAKKGKKSKKKGKAKRKTTKRKATKKKTTKRKGTKKKSTRKATKRVAAVPAGYHTVTPHLIVNDCAKAIDFYKRAFKAKEGQRYETPDGKIVHAEIKVGDSWVMLSDEMPPMPGQPGVYKSPKSAGFATAALFCYVKNADKTFASAKQAGCQVRQPVENQFWGDRYGQVIDPFGLTWAFATRKENLTKKQIQKRQDEFFAQMAAGGPPSQPTAAKPAATRPTATQPTATRQYDRQDGPAAAPPQPQRFESASTSKPAPIEHTLSVHASPTVIYDALVQPRGVQGWWSRNADIQTRVGGVNVLRFDKDGNSVTMKFRITHLEPNRIVWECTENGNPIWVGTKLVWEIQADGSASRVRFVHEGFQQGGAPYDMTVEGWQHFLDSFKQFVETGHGQPAN